jgi:hypothetical protein
VGASLMTAHEQSDQVSNGINRNVSARQNNTRSLKKRYIGLATLLGLFAAPLTAFALQGQNSTSSEPSNNSSNNTSRSETMQESTPPSENTNANSKDKNTGTNNNTSQSGSSSNSYSSTTNIKVNGQSIPVPNNGSVHRTMKSNDGQTTTQVTIDHSSTSNTQNSSSTNTDIHVSSDSSSEVSTEDSSTFN